MMMNKIAVLIPCYNEELTISRVVNDFQKSLPEATIYVYDNASTDNTSKVATKAGALVFQESNKGKGNVVRRMFADIESDVYVIVDGDDTYDASKCQEMVEYLIENSLDMVVANRKTNNSEGEYRWGHVFGNQMLTRSVSFISVHEETITERNTTIEK